MKLTTHLHLVPRSRMLGTILPLPNTPSWRGAKLKHRDNFTFTFIEFYKGVSKSFRTGRLGQELQMVQLSATRHGCIAFV
jgi:hypothetical protein